MFYQFNPVPYDFDFTLSLYTRNIEDGNQILEQIIPYFTPDYTIRVNMVPEMNLIRNIPIILSNISPAIESNGLFNSETRSVYWGLGFTVKGYIFGAAKEAQPIKHVEVNINHKNASQLEFTPSSGNFVFDEAVYQGISKDQATVFAKVVSWDATKNTLIVDQQYGSFIVNQPVVGETTIKVLKNAKNIKLTDRKTMILELLFHDNKDFKLGEVIYQGLSIEHKTASAIVAAWDSELNTLEIADIQGTFVANKPIIGINSNATKIIKNIRDYTKISTIISEVSPMTAEKNDNWTDDTYKV